MGKSSKMPQHHDDRMPRVPQSAGSSLTPLRPFVQPRNLVRCDCEEFRKTKPRSAEQPEWEESGPGSVLVPVWVEGPPLSTPAQYPPERGLHRSGRRSSPTSSHCGSF
ncbi:small nuclear ribonucleoprotein-associated protein N [Fukomys damarensis]|uniref:small nuclear ribonucleoprotein-associated protein N n=1 Tax=Fukomys damarensis TaxID=885580 RepID=UPI00053FAA6E|nr:small nuclear ribonucleoprotein-associated protein N [Fukomys damarensis]